MDSEVTISTFSQKCVKVNFFIYSLDYLLNCISHSWHVCRHFWQVNLLGWMIRTNVIYLKLFNAFVPKNCIKNLGYLNFSSFLDNNAVKYKCKFKYFFWWDVLFQINNTTDKHLYNRFCLEQTHSIGVIEIKILQLWDCFVDHNNMKFEIQTLQIIHPRLI